MKAPTTTEAKSNGKAQREFPRPEAMTKGKAKAPEITIPFHHHCAHERLK